MNKECDHCGIRFDFKKSDIKERLFASKGETFNSTEIDAIVRFFNSKSIFHTITWELDEDINFKGVKCECCNRINWMTGLTADPSNLKSSGWYIKKYGSMKCHMIKKKTNQYNCTKFEAEGYKLNNIVRDVMSEAKE